MSQPKRRAQYNVINNAVYHRPGNRYHADFVATSDGKVKIFRLDKHGNPMVVITLTKQDMKIIDRCRSLIPI